MVDETSFDAIATARSVIRNARSASLGTLDETGAPFVSLVTFATMPDLRPVLSLSDLAVHAKNLKRDPRASLLFVAPGGEGGNPLAGSRLTLTGRLAPTDDETALWRYQQMHGDGTTSFADFHTYRFEVSGSHLVAGFGRIVAIAPGELLPDHSDCGDLLAGEKMVVEHMNADHADAIGFYAVKLLGLEPANWRMTGSDPDGIDLAFSDRRARLDYPARARTVAEAGGYLKNFAKEARERA
jgi:hypothetical protein